MKNLPAGRGKEAGVVGMGRSGAAALRLLSASGYKVTGFDSSLQAVKPDNMTRLVTGDPRPEDFQPLSLIVLSPGVPPSSEIHRLAVGSGVPVIPEIELGWAFSEGDSIAVTGSNGKTTTVEWIGHVLKESPGYREAVVAGNMGYAMCDAVLDNPGCPVFSLELSSYQLETIQDFRPVSAAVLNLTPDHLARHGTMENYGEAKARIFMNQLKGDTGVLNRDDPLLVRMKESVKGTLLWFSLQEEVSRGAFLRSDGKIVYRDGMTETPVLDSSELGVPGRHNIANALAVICLTLSYGVPVESLRRSLRNFRGVPHRLEPLGCRRSLYWVNDSKSTNVDSLKVALESFNEKVILLAGGQGKDSDYSVLNALIGRKVKAAVLFGAAASALEQQWKGAAEILLEDNLEDAVKAAIRLASHGDTVLLSPGCASFDQYMNFEERGEHFRQIVGGLE